MMEDIATMTAGVIGWEIGKWISRHISEYMEKRMELRRWRRSQLAEFDSAWNEYDEYIRQRNERLKK